MTQHSCPVPSCLHGVGDVGDVPPEPPVRTWVKDRFGGVSQRQPNGWGQPGMMPLGRWEDMWRARGPLVVCGPWGKDLD